MRVLLKEIFIGDRIRKDYGPAELEQLRASMEENGQIQPIAVRPVADYDRREEDYEGQPWVLVAGGRRMDAAFLLGWKDIEAYAREEMAELTSKVLELHENLFRKPMSFQETLEAKRQIVELRKLENPDITLTEIAKELGESQATLSKDLKTEELIKKFPGLKKSSSKGAALQAGIILEANEARVKRASFDLTKLTAESAGKLEDRIKTADAVEFAKGLETDSIDLTLIDGPYGYNYWKQGHKTAGGEDGLSSYDDSPETAGVLYRLLIPELVRVTRSTGWLVCFAGHETYDYIQDLLTNCCAEHASYRHSVHVAQCEAVAGKPNPAGPCRWLSPNPYPWFWFRPNSRNRPRHPFLHAQNQGELILVCNMGKARLTKPCGSHLEYEAEYGTARVHANQKPVPLYRDLIERFTYAGDRVLDTFFGSGNSMGAAASLARIPCGCDKNPEMLPFAIGKVQQLGQLVTESTVKAAHERYLKNLANPYADLDFEEGEGEAQQTGPAPLQRAAGVPWLFEILQLPEGCLGLLTYDGHNMGQRQGKDIDALELELSECCRKLTQLSVLGIIDPCCCTPEEAMEALHEYEQSEKEDADAERVVSGTPGSE